MRSTAVRPGSVVALMTAATFPAWSPANTARVLRAILQGLRAQERTGSDEAAGVAFVGEFAPEFADNALAGPAFLADFSTELAVDTAAALFSVLQYVAEEAGREPSALLLDVLHTYRKAAPRE